MEEGNNVTTSWYGAVKDIADFYREVPKYSSQEQLMDMFREYKETGNREIRDRIIELNIRLPIKVVERYYNPDRKSVADAGDLVSIATVGLIQGVDAYNVESGNKPVTFFISCIKNEIHKYLYLCNMQKRKGMDTEGCLDEPISPGAPVTEKELIPDDTSIEDLIEDKVIIEQVMKIIDTHPHRDEVKMFFGIQQEPLIQPLIAEKQGVSRSTVINRIRKCMNDCRKQIG